MVIDEKVMEAAIARAIRDCMAEKSGTTNCTAVPAAPAAPAVTGAPVDIPVGVSNRHVHLSQSDLESLFGKGAELHVMKQLKQPGQFAAEETVTLRGPKGIFKKVRVLGPVRPDSQVEISKTDGFALGVSAPVRESGVLDGTPGITLEGPLGTLELPRGVIVAQRHIHLSEEQAAGWGVKDKDIVCVETSGTRGCILKNVVVRVSDRFEAEMHVDIDEANACEMKNDDIIKIMKVR